MNSGRKLKIDLDQLRYAPEANDAEKLLNDYGAATSIASIEREHCLHGKHPWDETMNSAIPLPSELAPSTFALVKQLIERLGANWMLNIYITPSPQINGMAFLDRVQTPANLLLFLTSRALEELSASELAFLVGHEMGHVAYEHDRMNLLCHAAEGTAGITVLPFLGEGMFLRWRKAAEISADRIGWLLSDCREVAAGAMIKATMGLSGKTLHLDSVSLNAFITAGRVTGPRVQSSHCHGAPLLPIRLKALQVLSQAFPSSVDWQKYLPRKKTVDKAIVPLLDSLTRNPISPVETACMTLIADIGVQVVLKDQVTVTDEIKKVMEILHNHYTDKPDAVIILDPQTRQSRIKAAIKRINREGTTQNKHEVLSRLADIAYADGSFIDGEGKLFLETARSLKVPESETYSIIIGCMQNNNRAVDPALLVLAGELNTQQGV